MTDDDLHFDGVTTAITDYAVGLDPASISDSSRHAMVSRFVEAIGCALAATDAGPCVAARSVAATAIGEPGASVIGVTRLSTPELAAFANGCMVRYLDFNDTYHTEGGGHPSDLMSAVLAATEITGGSGGDALTAMHIGYEVFASLADAVPMRDKGWDYGAFLGIATAAAVSRALGLDRAGTATAVSLAITPNMPLFVTRTGELSNWKGCASAYSAMAALFAARLAASGISAPLRPFEGKFGVWEQATGPFELPSLGAPVSGLSAVERTSCKSYPSDFETQIPSEIFIGLHDEGVRPADVEAINVSTYYVAWDLIGGGQGDRAEKWDPKRRETADHSLPYIISVALTDGQISKASFATERVLDPVLRPLMEKITVSEDPEITRRWHTHPAYDIEVRLGDSTRNFRLDHPMGHYLRPFTDAEVDRKFEANARTVLEPEATSALLSTLWAVDEFDDLDRVMELLREAGASGA